MPRFIVYRQGEPVPNGTKATFRYFDNGVGKMCTIEMNDHTPTFDQHGAIEANNGVHALQLAKETYPHLRGRVAVGPAEEFSELLS